MTGEPRGAKPVAGAATAHAIGGGGPGAPIPLALADGSGALPRFDQWASALLALLGVAGLIGLGLAASAASTTGEALVAVVGPAVGVVATWILVFGLVRAVRWARSTAVVALVVVALAGGLELIYRLQAGAITVPLGALAAIFVLRIERPPEPVLARRDRRARGVLVATLVGAFLWAPLAGAALAAGPTPLTVGPDALDLRVSVACSSDGGTRHVDVVATWAWRTRELFTGGMDGIAVTGQVDGPDGPEGLVVESFPGTLASGLWSGSEGPAGGALDRWAADSAAGIAVQVGIDVATADPAGGRVAVPLRVGGPGSAAGPITVRVAYAHRDRWLATAKETGCTTR